MESPWYPNGASVVGPLCLLGGFLAIPWSVYGESMIPCRVHGVSMAFTWWVHGASVEDPWWIRGGSNGTSVMGLGGSMVGPSLYQRGSVVGAWCFRGGSVWVHCRVHGCSMVGPWCAHDVPMMLPRCFRGGSVVGR